MTGCHHWLNGRESGWTLGVGDGQGGLACWDSWGRKESDTTEWLNWTELNWREDWSSKNFPGGSVGKDSACIAGDLGSIPGSGKSPGEGNGNPLQYSCLENPMDRGAWWATVHEVAKSRTGLSDYHFTSWLQGEKDLTKNLAYLLAVAIPLQITDILMYVWILMNLMWSLKC